MAAPEYAGGGDGAGDGGADGGGGGGRDEHECEAEDGNETDEEERGPNGSLSHGLTRNGRPRGL